MTNARRAISLATAALLLVAVTSCADDGDDPAASPTSPLPVRRPRRPVHPTPQSRQREAPPTRRPPSYGSTTTSGTSFGRTRASRCPMLDVSGDQHRADGAAEPLQAASASKACHQTGETKVVELKVQSVNLDNSDPKAGKVPTVQIDVCFDVSDVDVVDADGKSVVSPDRPDTGWIRFSVVELHVGHRSRRRLAGCLQPGHRAHAMRRLVSMSSSPHSRSRVSAPRRRARRRPTRTARSRTPRPAYA